MRKICVVLRWELLALHVPPTADFLFVDHIYCMQLPLDEYTLEKYTYSGYENFRNAGELLLAAAVANASINGWLYLFELGTDRFFPVWMIGLACVD